MGYCHGRLRFDRRHVPQLRSAARGGQYLAGRRLCRRVSPTAGGLARCALETAGQGRQGTGSLHFEKGGLNHPQHPPGRAVTAIDLAKQLKTKFGELLSEPGEFRKEITLKVADVEQMPEICVFAKKDL